MYICFWKLCTEKQNKKKQNFVFSKNLPSRTPGSWKLSVEAAESHCIVCKNRLSKRSEEEEEEEGGGRRWNQTSQLRTEINNRQHVKEHTGEHR